MLAVAFGKNYVGLSPTIGIFPYVAPAVEHVLSVAFEKKYGVSRPINGIFVYVAHAVESVLAVVFGIQKLTKGRHPYPGWDANPQSQQTRVRRPPGHWDR